jgi:hypothetical protein
MHTEFAASAMNRRHTLAGEMADTKAADAVRSARANGLLLGDTEHSARG